jgi:hypothetical protein
MSSANQSRKYKSGGYQNLKKKQRLEDLAQSQEEPKKSLFIMFA